MQRRGSVPQHPASQPLRHTVTVLRRLRSTAGQTRLRPPHRGSPQEHQSWNGVFSNPNHSILTTTLAETTSRFFIHPEREIALLGRPTDRRIRSGPLDDQWSIFLEIFPQPRVRGFVLLIALRLSEWIKGGDENAATLSGGEIKSL